MEYKEYKEYNIILEGCDGVGKTSIFEELMHRGLFGKKMIGIQHQNKMPPKSYLQGEILNKIFLRESNEFTGIVFDRHILSERVYAPIFRNYIPTYIGDLEKQLKPHNYLFLITADFKIVEKRFDGLVIPIDSLSKVINAYQFYFYKCYYPNKFIIDTTNITPFQALKKIEKIIKKTEEN